ncbi:hypothetical protein LTS18_013342, partial [Coniosporium uncinatum]
MTIPPPIHSTRHVRARNDGMTPSAPVPGIPLDDAASDYGSDFDPEGEQLVNNLLSGLERRETLALENIVEHEHPTCSAHVPVRPHSQPANSEAYFSGTEEEGEPRPGDENAHDDRAVSTHSTFARQSPVPDTERVKLEEPEGEPEQPDTRSPLARFRTRPKKGLSVTDIVSPAWCELQYWFTLTKHGRKKRTPAMRQGSRVHKVLEEQVHQVVPIQVTTIEDGWGLRIWNTIQGLRTLRSTGMTREMEIWGVLHGQVITGIIDELSYTCPDPELEADIGTKTPEGKVRMPANQKSIKEFYQSNQAPPFDASPWISDPHPKRK